MLNWPYDRPRYIISDSVDLHANSRNKDLFATCFQSTAADYKADDFNRQ